MSNYIKEKLEELCDIKIKLLDETTNGYEIKNLIGKLETELEYHPFIVIAWSSYYFERGNFKQAEQHLLKGLEKYPFNLDINYNLAEIYKSKNEIKKVFNYYARSVKYTSGESKQTMANLLKEYANEIIKTNPKINIELIKNSMQEAKAFWDEFDYQIFPLNPDYGSQIRKRLYAGRTNEGYFVNMYKSIFVLDIDINKRFSFKYELLKGSYAKDIQIHKDENDVIAISPVNEKLDIEFEFDDKKVTKKNLPLSRFTYYNIPTKGDVKVKSDKDFFVSHFKSGIVEGKPKLVLNIFIDGLSQKFLLQNGLSRLMPNTYSFFNDGFIANNNYLTGEWTLPSVSAVTTGRYTTNHNLFHPFLCYDFELYNKFIQEYFYDLGYMTSSICGNWRLNPNYGYYKKMDRTIYSAVERMCCDEVIMEAIEHLECFKNFSNYVWLSIFDLHSVDKGHNISPLSGIMEENISTSADDGDRKSVDADYDPSRASQYHAEIKKVDFFLEILFNYINKNYTKDEVLVFLYSDHGQSYLIKEDNFFAPFRSNVSLMMKGKGVPNKISDEIISNVDILPTILSLCGIQPDSYMDGRLMYDFGGERREYAYMESLYPSKTYKVSIVDKEHRFNFETKNVTSFDGAVDLTDYNVTLVNSETLADETYIHQDKVHKYEKVVFEHIKQWIKI